MMTTVQHNIIYRIMNLQYMMRSKMVLATVVVLVLLLCVHVGECMHKVKPDEKTEVLEARTKSTAATTGGEDEKQRHTMADDMKLLTANLPEKAQKILCGKTTVPPTVPSHRRRHAEDFDMIDCDGRTRRCIMHYILYYRSNR